LYLFFNQYLKKDGGTASGLREENARRSPKAVDMTSFRQQEEQRQAILVQILTPEAKERRISIYRQS